MIKQAVNETGYSPCRRGKKKSPTRCRAFRSKKLSAFLDIVALLEAVNASGSVDELLLSGKERMAGGANFDVDVLSGGRAGLDHASACALDLAIGVSGMNSFFHGILQIWMALIDAPRNSGLIEICELLFAILKAATGKPAGLFSTVEKAYGFFWEFFCKAKKLHVRSY